MAQEGPDEQNASKEINEVSHSSVSLSKWEFVFTIAKLAGLLILVIGIFLSSIYATLLPGILSAIIFAFLNLGNFSALFPPIWKNVQKLFQGRSLLHSFRPKSSRSIQTQQQKSSRSRNILEKVTSRRIRAISVTLTLLFFLWNPSLPQSIHDFVAQYLPQSCSDGLCVQVKGGQKIGISNGQSKDYFWTPKAGEINAEQLIYRENNAILSDSSKQYYEMVAVTTLSEGSGARHTGVGHDDLRGILALQELANNFPDQCLPGSVGCRRLVVLVANAGDNMEYATIVAQQILRVARANPTTFIGVAGWPVSTRPGIDGLRYLTDNRLSVVSSTASSDALSAFSPYFFRVVPPDSEQGPVGAHYAEQAYSDRPVAIVFYDETNPYSLTLASAFSGEFTKKEGNGVILEKYNGQLQGDQSVTNIVNDLKDAFSDLQGLLNGSHNEFIYFSGYSEDFSRLLGTLRTQFNNYKGIDYSSVPALSGDAAYDKSDFNKTAQGTVYNNLAFTAFAHPDEWQVNQEPPDVKAFFDIYQATFNRSSSASLDADTVLSFDSASVLLHAALRVTSFTPEHIQAALSSFNRCSPFQGVSGAIAFAPDGNPVQKIILMLTVDATGAVIFSPNSIQQGQLIAQAQQRC